MVNNKSIDIVNCSSSCNIIGGSLDRIVNSIGGLIGVAHPYGLDGEYLSISNCSATGDVNCHGDYAGGLIGSAGDSLLISNCFATGNVSGLSSIGGLIGVCYGKGSLVQTAKVIDCYSTGNVTVIDDPDNIYRMNRLGGFIGNLGGNVLINHCSTTAETLNGGEANQIGGFIGQCQFGGNTVIKNSYTLANVSGKSDVGGFIGYGGENTSIENCYSKGNVVATDINIGGFAGRSPKLTVNSVAYGDISGEGGSYIGGFFGRGSGDKVESCYAYGEVKGIDNVGGFVGACSTDTVNNCHAQQNMVVGGKNVGGFCGDLSNLSKVSNCTAEASVVGTGDYVGGFAGRNTANIIASWASGSASTPGNYVGGFIGGQANGSSTQCYASGNASGNKYVGGFAGKGNIMTQCFATGSVTGNDYVAGFAGYYGLTADDCFASGAVQCNRNYGSGFNNNGTIINSYTSSQISGSGENMAGLVSGNAFHASSNCYFDSTYNSQLKGAANGWYLNNHKGLLTEQFAYQSNFTDWDFNSIWQIATIAQIDMYPRPYHQWYMNKNTEAIPFTSLQIENQMSDTKTGYNQNSIQIIMPFNYDITSLSLEFELPEGTVLVINDSIQVSGVTLNDFSQPVICYFITVTTKSAVSGQEDSANEPQIWMIEVENEKYEIAFNYMGEGQVLGDTLQYIQKDSSTTEVLAIPASGYMFSEWLDENGNSFSKDSLLIVDDVVENGNYTALFELQTGITEIKDNGFSCYPNPTQSIVKIQFDKHYTGYH